jgi:AraC-like DNA-binding protein
LLAKTSPATYVTEEAKPVSSPFRRLLYCCMILRAPETLNSIPSPVVRRLLWHVLCIDRCVQRDEMAFDPSSRPGAILLWLDSGRAEMQLDSGVFQLRPGPFVWLCSLQQRRSHRSLDGKPFTVKSIRFSGPNLGAWVDELGAETEPEFAVPLPNFFARGHEQLAELIVARPPAWEHRVDKVLSNILARLLALRKPTALASKNLPAPTIKVLDALIADPDRDWTASELARLTGVSYSHLRHLFRESMHESIHSFLQKKRIDRAQILLAAGKQSVKEIAWQLHFGHECYFSSFFKARTGVSPTEFRKQTGVAPRNSAYS